MVLPHTEVNINKEDMETEQWPEGVRTPGECDSTGAGTLFHKGRREVVNNKKNIYRVRIFFKGYALIYLVHIITLLSIIPILYRSTMSNAAERSVI